MIDKRLIEILLCPENNTPLREADGALLAKLNHAIADGEVKTRGGSKVETPLVAGLVRQGNDYLYPIVDDIPVLLIDEAISLKQLEE